MNSILSVSALIKISLGYDRSFLVILALLLCTDVLKRSGLTRPFAYPRPLLIEKLCPVAVV